MELTKFQQEKSIAELRAQLEGMREHLSAKERMMANHANLADQANSQRASTEDQLAMYKQQAQQLEEKFALSAKEIEKGNQIIRGLQAQVKQMKTKLRIKVTALAQQEKALLELEKENEKGKYVAEEKELGLGRAKEKEEHLHLQAENLREKLAEAHKVIQSNQEVIEYLNRQLTERDLRGFSPGSIGGTGATLSAAAGGSSGAGLWSISQSTRQPLRENPGTPEKYGLRLGKFDSSLSGLTTQTGSDLKDLLKSISSGTSAGVTSAGKLTSATSSALFNVPTLDQMQVSAGRSAVGEGHATFSHLDFAKLTGTSPSLSGAVAGTSPSLSGAVAGASSSLGGVAGTSPHLGNVTGSSGASLSGPVAYRKPC